MKLGQILATTLLLIFTHLHLNAQVQFMLDLDPKTKTYVVSMLPNVTWEYPHNRTATAQITIKAPTGAFDLKDFTSLTPGIDWDMNSRVDSPTEAPEYDYLSFSLLTTGLESIEFTKGKPTKLFCFKNNSSCSGQVSLINNNNDPFLPPNSRNANIGNSIAVHGAKGEAYTKNVSNKAFECDFGIKTKQEAVLIPQITVSLEAYTEIFPNPSSELVNIAFSWDQTEGDKDILLYDGNGALAQFYTERLIAGDNQLSLDVSTLIGGIYHIIIVDNGNRISLGKMMKIR